MLLISDRFFSGHEESRKQVLAAKLLHLLPALESLNIAIHYIDEALDCGMEVDRDIAEYAYLLIGVDRAGRPKQIDDIVRDPLSTGALKLFQIRYALHGERA